MHLSCIQNEVVRIFDVLDSWACFGGKNSFSIDGCSAGCVAFILPAVVLNINSTKHSL